MPTCLIRPNSSSQKPIWRWRVEPKLLDNGGIKSASVASVTIEQTCSSFVQLQYMLGAIKVNPASAEKGCTPAALQRSTLVVETPGLSPNTSRIRQPPMSIQVVDKDQHRIAIHARTVPAGPSDCAVANDSRMAHHDQHKSSSKVAVMEVFPGVVVFGRQGTRIRKPFPRRRHQSKHDVLDLFTAPSM